MHSLKWKNPCIWLLLIMLLASCDLLLPEIPAMTLDQQRAAQGEVVTAALTGLDPEIAEVFVADIETNIVDRNTKAETISFIIPAEVSGGPATVKVEAGERAAVATISVLGDVVAGAVDLVISSEISRPELEKLLNDINPDFVIEEFQRLGAADGPCSGVLASIDVGEVPLGEALEALEELEKAGAAYYIDPVSGYDVGTIDHLGAIGARQAHLRGLSGEGAIIAVLDTGVSPHPELTGRLLTAAGYDYVDNDADASDTYDNPSTTFTPDGHGTPIAVLAAGSLSGVAPAADILPLRVCDEDGRCLSSDVILGVCHALNVAEDKAATEQLVVNLSLGGDTPVGALKAILGYALEHGALVAAAGGNGGQQGSPRHYPAAYELDGLLAVAALEAAVEPTCVDFDDLAPGAVVTIEETLETSGFTLQGEEFFFLDGRSTTRGSAVVVAASPTDQELFISNINVAAELDTPLPGLELEYTDGGNNINLIVNGELANQENLTDVASPVGGVQVTASAAETGILSLRGDISAFAIGGQELAIDNICTIVGAQARWHPAAFSTRGDYLDIAAPGAGLTSGAPNGLYFSGYEGTSFATPLAAGALALWREANPNASAAEIETGIKASARALPYPEVAVGKGMLELSDKP